MFRLLLLLVAIGVSCSARPLLVLSIDGLDHRYLRDADKLGLKIPNLRRLMREGITANGVVGVVPTVTWPSHTTLITGEIPARHGILGNRRPKSEGGDYYWTADLLKVPTLLDAARKQGLITAAITWPVTVDAPVDYNLPEAFSKRNGGGMDLETIGKKATSGLVDEIARAYPAFPKAWVDDRSRALATMFLVQQKKPDLALVHFVDHDAEAHEHGPFSREANALVEYTDELIGDILRVLPKDYAIAIVSDHGFERSDRAIKIEGEGLVVSPYLVIAKDEAAALRARSAGVGREILIDEVRRLGPQLPAGVAAWEPPTHALFGTLHEGGNHGYWPTREDYRSVFVLWGTGKGELPELQMTGIAARLAQVVGIRWSAAP